MGWANVNRSVSPITTDEVAGPKLVKRKVEPRVVLLLKVGPKPNSPVVVSLTLRLTHLVSSEGREIKT